MTEQQLFQAVLDLPDAAAREDYLGRACEGDPARRARIDALLRSHDLAGSFLGTPAIDRDGTDPAETTDGSPLPRNASAVGTGHPPDAADDDFRGVLTPSTRPGSLGRLGHYEVLQVLGRGAFGVVFRALDDVLERVVAVKMMVSEMAATSPARKRFLREARASAAVRHENVVQVYEVAEQPLPYLVMEFIPGETLQSRIDRTGPLDVAETLRIGRQIAEGLAAAHASDLVHRDVKPGNVMIEGGTHRVKLTDFGLARTADDASMTQSGMIAGTPLYMAPEQALGQSTDQRADLFSLGSVLYHMVSGRAPFRANNTLAVMKRVAEDTPRPIAEIIPETPAWLSAIITKLHAKNPAERFASAREVADVLADCEGQLKANSKLRDFSRIPRVKSAAGGGRRKWVAAAVLSLPLIVLAVTEMAGVTHVFRGRQAGPVVDKRPGAASAVPAIAPATTRPPQPTVAPTVTAATPLPPTFTNAVGMEFVIVPKGKSWLGGGKDQPGDKEVEISADFYLGKHEVTQAQWEKVTGENPSHFSRTGAGKDAVRDVPDDDLKRFPVENVSWDQCQAFVEKLNKLGAGAGWAYRLPTRAEWEYACRGGSMADKADSAFDFYFATPSNTLLAGDANFDNGMKRTCAVGSYRPNQLGLFDLHGNVQEWCGDGEPPTTDHAKRLRGGSFRLGRCDAKGVAGARPSFRADDLGLRLACVPAGAGSPEATAPPLAGAAFTDADVRRIAALPAAEQVEAVRAALRRLNPEFDGELAPTIDGGVLVGLTFSTDHVTDVSPVRGLGGLRTLIVNGSSRDKGALADLSPLKGMALTRLGVGFNRIRDLTPLQGMPLTWLFVWQWKGADLSPLKGMPLEWLNVGGSSGGPAVDLAPLAGMPLKFLCVNFAPVSDLAPLKGLPLTKLECQNTPVSDLAPLAGMRLDSLRLANTKVSDLGPLGGMPIAELAIEGTPVADLSPLKGMPLKSLRCDFRPERDAATLAAIATLATINDRPAAEFWARVQKGESVELKGGAGVKAAAPDADRRAAAYVLSVGGVVRFNGDVREVRTAADLPPAPATLTTVELTANERVTDAGLAVFKDCKNLAELSLPFTPVGDAGLAHFKGCTGLTVLHLGGCANVTDAGLANFKDCKRLETLNLHDTRVTDAGLAHFKAATNLTYVGLNASPAVTDAGLAHLADCKTLARLHVVGVPITDAALARLATLKELTELHVAKTKVTEKGVRDLSKVLPKCTIEWDGGVIPPTASLATETPKTEK